MNAATGPALSGQMRRVRHSPGRGANLTLHPGPPLVAKLPLVAQPDDGNAWVTGRCWLWCGRELALVVGIGSASVSGVTAGVYVCGDCLGVLADQIIATQMVGGLTEGLDDIWLGDGAHGPPTGRHRRRADSGF